MADINDWEEYEETTAKAGKLSLTDKKGTSSSNIESEEIIKPKEEKKATAAKKTESKETSSSAKAQKTDLVKPSDSSSANASTENKESILNQQAPLGNEKDFVDLSVLSVAKIKDANKLSKFTLSYLKKNIEELASTLEPARIDELIKNLTVLFNKKRKEESEKYGKKPKSKQPSIVAGKALDSAAAKGNLDVYDDDEYSDDYDNDDFM